MSQNFSFSLIKNILYTNENGKPFETKLIAFANDQYAEIDLSVPADE
jgi:hypothetical protein